MTIALISGGLVLLVAGGELLVRGATALAAAVGISPLVIGLTVVAFGTSSPELAVSLQAGLGGNADIALGNVVGSNIFNILFILGLCALILPLRVSAQLIRFDVPLMIGASFLLLALCAFDARLQWYDGLLLFAGIVAYTGWSIWQSRNETAAAQAEFAREYGPQQVAVKSGRRALLRHLAFIAGGLAVLVLGSRWLVTGSVALASALGVADVVIGLTIVAAGTSMPEVATSLIATLRKERDIAIGNVVGSNLFNIFGILGLATLATPGGLSVAPQVLRFDLPIMIAVAVACFPIFFSGFSIARWEGAVFFVCYIAYTLFLVLLATGNPLLDRVSSAMLLALPLVAVAIVASALHFRRSLRRNDRRDLPA